MTITELTTFLKNVLDFNAKSEEDGSIFYTCKSYMGEESSFIISSEDVKSLLQCDDEIKSSPAHLITTDYCEFILRDTAGMPYRYRESKVYEDNDNHVKYEFGEFSDRLSLAILRYADRNNELKQEIQARIRRTLSARMGNNSLWFLRCIAPVRFASLRITPLAGYSLDRIDCVMLCTSFSFNFAYNLSRVIFQIEQVEDAYDLNEYRRSRRIRSDLLEAPKRKYQPELVNFYLRGVSGDTKDYQFLSYYHVLEYFFEKVFLDNVVDQIRYELTLPSFSYKREKDIKSLYGKIRKIVKDTSDQSTINELESLKLTLKTYVSDLQRVKDNLNDLSDKVIDYLKTNGGAFAKNQINFDDAKVEAVYANIANRIYQTRNAIAHSKESDDKKKFVPYVNDSDLQNEVLLIRIIAEEVIINSSKEI